ncbi:MULTISPECIES: hypothetical protein [unclassified Chelatococcus]|uniref:hypothetical protein n=1 Tax=unclassified Chelatococcus TaxID=2638111 RepID=UPI001BCEAE7F|nr:MULTISPECIES: hypothetical protein [unclassified Chelatococcus]MBS7699930.1 hypothetical protein [Chelatococcus sp. YT9]MBX3558645.1 hypothetical protein [Chelatococcus sp.]
MKLSKEDHAQMEAFLETILNGVRDRTCSVATAKTHLMEAIHAIDEGRSQDFMSWAKMAMKDWSSRH